VERDVPRTSDRTDWSAHAAAVLIVMLFLGFAALLVVWVWSEYNSANRRVEERVEAGAKIVATNAGWIDALARQALRRIDEAMGPEIKGMPGRDISDISQAVESLPGQVKAYVVNEHGETVYSTDPQVKPVNIQDREYFAGPAKGELWHVSSLLVSRLNGEQIFTFSRRLSRGAKFAGVAIISFDVKSLQTVWESVDLGPKSTVSIIRNDGMLVGRYPLAEGPLDMSSYVLFTEYLKAHDSGTYLATSPLDAADRIVAYRKVPETEFVAIAAIDHQDAMAPFWRNVYVMLAFVIPAVVGFLVAGFWVVRLLQRDARRRRALEEALKQNQFLLGEIHHRVKNNLQAVQSLIRLQNISPEAKTGLINRLSAMVTVHEQIYRRDRFLEIPAKELIPAVVSLLIEAYGRPVEASYAIDEIGVSDEQATALALLVNEVVTNSLKYAFSETQQGTITVSMRYADDDQIELVIADNGPGFDPADVAKGMGSKLLAGVVAQLGGSYRYEMQNGAWFVAEFSRHMLQPVRTETA
jgi:two-component sensor histidine kinase